MGTSNNNFLNRIFKYIWEWCAERRIWIIPVYVNTIQNRADKRDLYIQGVSMLIKKYLEKIEKSFKFSPNIELLES